MNRKKGNIRKIDLKKLREQRKVLFDTFDKIVKKEISLDRAEKIIKEAEKINKKIE